MQYATNERDSKKLTPYLFQNDVVFFKMMLPYVIENEKMRLTSIFGTSIS